MKFNDTDQFAVNRGGVTYRVSFDDLASDIELKLNLDQYASLSGAAFTGEVSFLGNQTRFIDKKIKTSSDIEFYVGNIEWGISWKLGTDGTIADGDGDGNKIDIIMGTIDFENFKANPRGDVTASHFIGDGSQLTNLPTVDYADLTNKPVIPDPVVPGDGKLTIMDEEANVLGEFTANQNSGSVVVIPSGSAVQWDDIEGKPNIPEGPPECPVHQVEYVDPYDWDDDDDEKPNIDVIEESPAFDEDWEYFRMPYDPAFKAVGLNIKFRTAPDRDWDESKIVSWQHYTSNDSNHGLNGEYLNIQVGDDYNDDWSEITAVNCGPIKDGTLHILNGRGREIGKFSANQEMDGLVKIPSAATLMDDCDAPHTMNWVHIKNVRGGKLRIINHDTTFVSLEVLNVGNNYAYSNFLREKKRYGSALMVFGNESIGKIDGGSSYPGKPQRAFMYGDATLASQGLEPSGDWDEPNWGAGAAWITAQGQNPDNWFGTGDRRTENRYGHEDSCCILPTCLMKNAEGEEVEVPNNFEYLVYFSGDFNHTPNYSIFQGEEGCTYDLGPLTYTVNAKNMGCFYKKGTVPHRGFRFMQTPKNENFFEMFYQCNNLGESPELYFWDTSSGKDFTRMFHSEKNFDADLSNWDMTKAQITHQMFESCENFTCGGKSRAGEGLDNWQLLSLDGDAGGKTFHMCYELAHDISSMRIPKITSMDAQIKPLYEFNSKTRVDFDNGGTVHGNESSTNGDLTPWSTVSPNPVARYVYVSANRFTRDPLWGPDRMGKDENDKTVVVNKGWTPEFSIERRKIWQEYIEWSDQTVEDGTRSGYNDESGGFHEKHAELKARDDLLCEQYFDPTWGDVKMKSDGNPKRIYDEGSPLADPVEPARAWSANGTTFKIKIQWTKEYFSSQNFKGEWISSNTNIEWTIISGEDKVSLSSMTTGLPEITFTGDTDDEAVLEATLTQSNDPTVSETFRLIILGADSNPSP